MYGRLSNGEDNSENKDIKVNPELEIDDTVLISATDIPDKDEKEQGCVDVESSITKEYDSMDNEEHGSDVGSSSCKDCEFTVSGLK